MPYVLDPDAKRVYDDGHNGAEVPLEPRLFAVLEELVRHTGAVRSKTHLLNAIGKGSTKDNTIAVSIVHLRKIFGARSITTHPGYGYRLVPNIVFLERRNNEEVLNKQRKMSPIMVDALRDLAIAASKMADLLEEEAGR